MSRCSEWSDDVRSEHDSLLNVPLLKILSSWLLPPRDYSYPEWLVERVSMRSFLKAMQTCEVLQKSETFEARGNIIRDGLSALG